MILDAMITDPTTKCAEMILTLFAEATAEQTHERRSEVHYPFFCPVTIAFDNDTCERKSFSAFSREISLSGMGLLHNMPLECEDVVLSVYRREGGTMNLPARIMWCRPCGEGWYLSGAQFA